MICLKRNSRPVLDLQPASIFGRAPVITGRPGPSTARFSWIFQVLDDLIFLMDLGGTRDGLCQWSAGPERAPWHSCSGNLDILETIRRPKTNCQSISCEFFPAEVSFEM